MHRSQLPLAITAPNPPARFAAQLCDSVGHLTRYTHWVLVCKRLLCDKPLNVAIFDRDGSGAILMGAEDELFVVSARALAKPKLSATDLIPVSSDGWDFVCGCWYGCNVEECVAFLKNPDYGLIKLP